MTETRDHGGGLDAAVARYGGARAEWLDLSTGINPVPYPVGEISEGAWTALPDTGAQDRLITAARTFWNVPEGAEVIAAPGASALITRMPLIAGATHADIPTPTYNEHAAAFRAHGAMVREAGAQACVLVHPNNPDGKLWPAGRISPDQFTVIDESFCDICPDQSHIAKSAEPNTVILKSFGKFWGLAGLRLGFAVGSGEVVSRMVDQLGPWAVSGPALEISARALNDISWAENTRVRLAVDAARLDAMMVGAGASVVGGTDLFRLYDVGDAAAWQDQLAQGHVWSRIFPYSDRWLRLGLPAPDRWKQLEAALA
jgi:cobalamin biosynthetic protein CobC